ncbi:DUF6207 family protein [Streptomyces sp. NPDC088358]|uniref:DUF6207 family protein n=1 Tax=Streptomyces sp. NPDC088358 TaxID=3365857 RepID=UPI00382F05D2
MWLSLTTRTAVAFQATLAGMWAATSVEHTTRDPGQPGVQLRCCQRRVPPSRPMVLEVYADEEHPRCSSSHPTSPVSAARCMPLLIRSPSPRMLCRTVVRAVCHLSSTE